MATIAAIRAGVRDRLGTIAGLGVSTEWPDQVVPPAALIKAVGGEYEQTFGADTETLRLEVHMALALKGGLVNAQQNIEQYLSNTGTNSIRAAIAADRTLGGVVKYTFVRGWEAEDVVEINEQRFMGAIVNLECVLA